MNHNEEHSNHHEHEHSGESSCHHEHEHSGECSYHHEHEYNHDHAQRREHGHYHDYSDYHGNIVVETCLHEEATVASADFMMQETMPEAEAKMKNLLSDLAIWVNEKGGVVGHIKSSLQSEGRTTMISVTEEEVHSKYMEPLNVKIGMAAIVFGISQSELKCKIENLLSMQHL